MTFGLRVTMFNANWFFTLHADFSSWALFFIIFMLAHKTTSFLPRMTTIIFIGLTVTCIRLFERVNTDSQHVFNGPSSREIKMNLHLWARFLITGMRKFSINCSQLLNRQCVSCFLVDRLGVRSAASEKYSAGYCNRTQAIFPTY